jgi:phage terminase large subunit
MIEPTFFIQHIPQPRIVAPVRYPHIWEGAYATAFEGAYFAKHLEQARQQGRIGHVAVDPILPVKAFMDIGGAGHSSDAMGIWLTQFAGREIRLLDAHNNITGKRYVDHWR